MKVLLVAPLAPPIGGMATWTEQYIKTMRGQCEFDIINSAVLGMRSRQYFRRDFIAETKRAVIIVVKLVRHLKKREYEVLHVSSACTTLGLLRDLIVVITAKAWNVKVVAHFHCDTAFMVRTLLAKALFYIMCMFSNEIFCMNPSSCRQVLQMTGKVALYVPNFVDMSSFDTCHRLQAAEMKRVLYVGHISRAKGCIEIISSAARFPELTFTLIGSPSPEISKLSLPTNVRILGEVSSDQVFHYMANSDILLFPSHSEGFPFVIIEAMACRLPIIASNVGAIPEILENTGGILIPINNVQSICDAIESARPVEKRLDMAERGYERIRREYSSTKMQQILAGVYTRLSKS